MATDVFWDFQATRGHAWVSVNHRPASGVSSALRVAAPQARTFGLITETRRFYALGVQFDWRASQSVRYGERFGFTGRRRIHTRECDSDFPAEVGNAQVVKRTMLQPDPTFYVARVLTKPSDSGRLFFDRLLVHRSRLVSLGVSARALIYDSGICHGGQGGRKR